MENFLTTFSTGNFFYFLIVIGIFAIGDYLGILTKAKVSAVFVALFLFLVGFLTNVFPPNIIELAGLAEFGQMSGAILIFHMGTMIDLRQLAQEWRTVLTALLSMIVVMIACFAVAPFLGMKNVIVAIPVINGGIVSTQIMSEAAGELGLAIPAALGVILYAIKKFVGSYPASFFGVKEATRVLESYRSNKNSYQTTAKKASTIERKGFASRYNKYFTDFTCLAVAVLFAWLSDGLGQLTPINYSIWALLFGAILSYIQMVPGRILEKGKSSGLLSMLVFAVIVPSLAKITFSDLMTLGLTIVALLAVSLIGLFIAFYLLPGYKISQSKNLAMGIAMGQFLGFPATFLISNEIAKAVTDDEEEQQVVLDHIMPAYVVAGLATVTTFSIVIAGIFVEFL